MQAERGVLLDAVVEGGRAPGGREEDHADGLAEVVEREAAGADAGQDRGVRDGGVGDGGGAAAEGEVGVGGRSGWGGQ